MHDKMHPRINKQKTDSNISLLFALDNDATCVVFAQLLSSRIRMCTSVMIICRSIGVLFFYEL